MLAVQSLPTAAAVAAAAATAKIQAIDAVASNLGLSTSEILGRSMFLYDLRGTLTEGGPQYC
jgi:hypothetical protein